MNQLNISSFLRSIIILVSIVLLSNSMVFSQTQSGCTITFPNNFDAQVNVSTIYNPALCPTGDLIIDNLNDKNGLSTVTFDADITLNSLTLNYKNGSNPLEIIIPLGITVTVTTDLVMNVNSTPLDKYLTVEGTLIVGGTLDFGNINLEIDGTGTISAGAIIGASSTTCTSVADGGTGTGTCPLIATSTCDPPTSGLCIDPVLPIELLFFSGAENNESILLNWATASEENFDYFEIQRTYEGTTFENIGKVKGNGNSYSKLEYNFTDDSPELGLNYYRLKSIDLDGSFEYSEVILVKFSSTIQLKISPNPSNGIISIKTNQPIKGSLAFEITSQFGTRVYSGTLTEFNTQVNLGELTKGVYIVRLIGLSNVKSQRFILK